MEQLFLAPPNLQSYAEVIVELTARSEVAALVTVGAHIADIPHTRPFGVTGSTTDAGGGFDVGPTGHVPGVGRTMEGAWSA